MNNERSGNVTKGAPNDEEPRAAYKVCTFFRSNRGTAGGVENLARPLDGDTVGDMLGVLPLR